MKYLAALTIFMSVGCVKQSYVPTIGAYTCQAQLAQVATIVNQTRPELPSVITLPSTERVYVEASGRVYHYDGPVCQ